jgi:protein TonB
VGALAKGWTVLDRTRPGAARRGWLLASVALHAAALAALAWRPPRAARPIGVLILPPGARPDAASPRLPPLPRLARTDAPGTPRASGEGRAGSARRAGRAAAPGRAALAARGLPAAPVRSAAEPLAADGSGAPGTRFAGADVRAPGPPPAPVHPGAPEGSGGDAAASPADDPGAWLESHRHAILVQVQQHIDRSPYPEIALLRRWEGLVRVAFVLREDGSVANARVAASSGRAILDRAALEAVREAAPYPRPPRELAMVVPIRFVVTD